MKILILSYKWTYTAEHLVLAGTTVEILTRDSTNKHLSKNKYYTCIVLPVHNFGWKGNNSALYCRGVRVEHLQQKRLSSQWLSLFPSGPSFKRQNGTSN